MLVLVRMTVLHVRLQVALLRGVVRTVRTLVRTLPSMLPLVNSELSLGHTAVTAHCAAEGLLVTVLVLHVGVEGVLETCAVVTQSALVRALVRHMDIVVGVQLLAGAAVELAPLAVEEPVDWSWVSVFAEHVGLEVTPPLGTVAAQCALVLWRIRP